ncbi:hypothetical protein I5535_12700 [Rhodobacteraceae bacterium F11138]|nr:hypothetical protein [Rhodobacteraceae bacterium F11138]
MARIRCSLAWMPQSVRPKAERITQAEAIIGRANQKNGKECEGQQLVHCDAGPIEIETLDPAHAVVAAQPA